MQSTGGNGRDETLTWDAELAVAALEAMSEIVLVKGPRSRLVWGNRAFREVYGVTEEQIPTLGLDGDHADPDDTLQYVRDDHRVHTTGETIDIGTEPITSADGEVSYIHTIKSPLVDRHGVTVGTVGVSRPVEVEQAVDPLAHQRQRELRHDSLDALRALVSSLPTAVAMFDATQRLIAWSDAFNELLGEEPGAELFGRTQLDVVEAVVPIAGDLARVLENGRARARILEVGPRRLSVEIRAWNTHDGRAGGAIAAMHDVTQLVEVQERLTAANDELVQFNYRASHDLVAPLSTVSGTLQLVEDLVADGDTDEVGELIGMAHLEVDRLRSLVGDLIDLARSDATAVEVDDIDLAGIVADVVEAHDDEIRAAGISVEVDVAVGPVRSVGIRLRQVLENLVSNALKFVDPDEPAPSISISATAARRLEIEVSDNGRGVPDHVVDDIFDLFVRGSSHTAGHGLGLYIVNKHVDRLGGSIELSSAAKPTRFTITLPTNEATAP